MRAPRGLQVEIVASLFVVMLAGLALVAVAVGGLAAASVEREASAGLERGAARLQALLSGGTRRLSDLAAVVVTLKQRGFGGSWTVHDARGRRLSSGTREPVSAELLALFERARSEGQLLVGGGLPPSDLVLVVPLAAANGEQGMLVGRVRAEEVRARLIPLFGSGLWVLSIAAVVFVAFGSWLLRHRIVLPLRRLGDAADRIAAGDLALRVEVNGGNELSQLAWRMSEMAASLSQQRVELLRAQASLSRSERLASTGRLAAGVAHEVGNPVAAILGYADLVARDAAAGADARERVGRIREEALRIRALVRELLDLARAEAVERTRCAPRELVARALARLRPQPLLSGVALDVRIEPDLPAVDVDARRVEQVLVNLVENAAHALRGADSPAIELSAQRASLCIHAPRRRAGDLEKPPAEPDPRAGVALSVLDNGPGIEAEHLPHVFDPFFTTKDPGEGSGLGLWNAHRVAEMLGGTLEVESRPGHTRFSLVLPAADTRGGDDPAARADRR
jgi:signal transduction histidine kinase